MSVVSLRYAHAFEQVVISSKLDASAALQQLIDFAATLDGSAELREFMTNPSIAKEQMLKVLDAIADKIGMMSQVRNFIAVITEHQRLHEMNEILAEYAAIADNQAGIADAQITSAHPLNPDDRTQLEEQVAALAGSRIRTVYFEDAALLGGAIVKLGSTVYDGSVRGQLQRIKQSLINA